MRRDALHIQIFFNEQLNLDFYVTNELRPLAKRIGDDVLCENVVVNYDLNNVDNKFIKKVVFDDSVFYEINFEKVCYVERSNFSKLENYLIDFARLFFKESATDLITFLKSLNCLTDDNLLEIESNFNYEKKMNYKKKLKARYEF